MFAARSSSLIGRQAALLLAVLFALFMRAVIPAGYMPEQQSTGWVISLCSGQGVKMVIVDHDGQPVEQDTNSDGAQSACIFTNLAAPALLAAPPVLLALAVAYIMARGFAPTIEAARRLAERLRPPLRAPPIH